MTEETTPQPVSLADMAKTATRARRNATVCLAGHLAAEYEQLEQRLGELVQAARFSDSLADEATAERVQIAERMEHLRGQMLAQQGIFTFEYIGGTEWSDLLASETDKEAQALAACLGTLVEFNGLPVTKDDKQALTKLWPTLNVGQRDELVTAALEANTGRVSVPFSPLVSATLRLTEER